MKTPHPGLPEGKIAYIKKLELAALPDAIREQVPEFSAIWGIHNAKGEVLALAQDRHVAFVVARQNDLDPVSAH